MQPAYNDKRRVSGYAHILETIVRNRIKDSLFYKQHLYLTNEQTILQVIVDNVKYVGGLDSSNRPSPFLCCLLRLLEIGPSAAVVGLYLKQPEFKYLTILTLIYIRLTQPPTEVYQVLDTYRSNYTKVRVLLSSPEMVDGVPVNYGIIHIDEFVDELERSDRVVGVVMPRLESRRRLVARGMIPDRVYHVQTLDEPESSDFSSDSD
ncbi:hypothetical protein PSN45_000067 [Yamadazyma tenuis]|uniref:Pre-mRNA-splicing factor 38 n=1 Tax=Candida tenuis (strain ATCC 10573 / BCRC 21748 / CBS 615 / JCM 9827 / NBRC 10315 / NRRL Y-1498 / VKM Y-70) TaxID=590646 RepID=G3BAA6_CANTC|nr:uncharacterized protein CANTEDRAFT_124012 [Yamadazyma tenuis ATCC 10573]EGV61394.1 hypothetical protein CANTEDRAFT_124012 [Yamadazyma tenuis ATCC 10573]WEJ92614.1 hypothetical protein PSN45_000067 [Yamadazyma tenuis]